MPPFALLTWMLAAAPAPAALPAPCASIDLPSALAMVARRSDEVAIKQADVEAAKVDQALASAIRFIPKADLTVVGGVVPSAHGNVVEWETSNRSLAGLGPFIRTDLNVVQPLFTWGQLTAARDAANAGYRARTLLVTDQVAAVQLRVIQLFWAQAMATKLLAIAAQVDKALVQVDQKIDESLKADDGAVTTEDRYRVAVFKSQLLAKKADAEKGLALAKVGLAATLALDPAGVQFESPALDAEAAPLPRLAQLRADAEAQRPDLRALDAAIDAKRADVKAHFGAMLPSVFVAGQFSFAYAPNRDVQFSPWVLDPFRHVTAGLVLGLRQNLALPTLIEQSKKSKAELHGLEVKRRALARLVDVQVESARVEADTAQTKLDAARGALGAGKAMFRSATLNFGLGVDDAKAVLEAYQAYVLSQVSLAQASYEVLVARAKLRQLTGQSLSQGEGKCVLP